MSIWKWCRIPGIRSTYSPVNFTREHAGQIIFLHFSNSIVNMLAKSENMLAKSLVNMLTEALVNMLTEALVNMLTKSLVNLLAESLESLVNMLAWHLVKMLTESLVNMLAESLLNILAELLASLLNKTMINIYISRQALRYIRYIKYDESSTITLKSFLKCRFFLVDHLKTSNWVYNFVVQIWLLWSCVFLSTWLKECKSSFLVEEQLSNYSNIREKSLLHE